MVRLTRYYAGIGSRETPGPVLGDMAVLARWMTEAGFTLRSGHAPGADTAFEKAAGAAEIWLPWLGFRGSDSRLVPSPEAFRLAEGHHPAWHRCSDAARKLHARNSHIVLGQDLHSPVEFVLCWTRNGERGGGTGQALRIAVAHGIPIFDLGMSKRLLPRPQLEATLAKIINEGSPA